MARVTVDDCINHIEDRFQVVLVAAKRCRDLSDGKAVTTIETINEKNTVIALREIANGLIKSEYL